MSDIYTAAPRHFAGELVAKQVDCCAGLHRMEVRLVDDEQRTHVVYLAYGRGDAAEQHAEVQFHRLSVGAWYYGSATLMRRTTSQTEWAGHVPPLQQCQRRQRFAGCTATAGAAA